MEAQEIAQVLDKLREAVETASVSVSNWKTENRDLRSKIRILKERFSNDQTFELSQRKDRLSKALAEITSSLDLTETYRDGLILKLKLHEQNTEADLDALAKNYEEFLVGGSNFRSKCEETVKKTQLLYQQVSQKKRDFECLKHKENCLKDQYESMKDREADVLKTLEVKKAEILKSERARKDQMEKNDGLRFELEALKLEISQANESIEELFAIASSLRKKNQISQNELRTLQQEEQTMQKAQQQHLEGSFEHEGDLCYIQSNINKQQFHSTRGRGRSRGRNSSASQLSKSSECGNNMSRMNNGALVGNSQYMHTENVQSQIPNLNQTVNNSMQTYSKIAPRKDFNNQKGFTSAKGKPMHPLHVIKGSQSNYQENSLKNSDNPYQFALYGSGNTTDAGSQSRNYAQASLGQPKSNSATTDAHSMKSGNSNIRIGNQTYADNRSQLQKQVSYNGDYSSGENQSYHLKTEQNTTNNKNKRSWENKNSNFYL